MKWQCSSTTIVAQQQIKNMMKDRNRPTHFLCVATNWDKFTILDKC